MFTNKAVTQRRGSQWKLLLKPNIRPCAAIFFNRHKLAAAVVGIVGATGISFSMSRWMVFSRTPPGNAGRRECRSGGGRPRDAGPASNP